MAHLLPRRAPYVCKACRSAQASRTIFRPFSSTIQRSVTLRQQLEADSVDSTTARHRGKGRDLQDAAARTVHNTQYTPSQPTPRDDAQPIPQAPLSHQDVATTTTLPRNTLKDIQEGVLTLLEAEQIPTEKAVLDLLAKAEQLATTLTNIKAQESRPQAQQELVARQQTQTPTSRGALLTDLNETGSQDNRPQKAPAARSLISQIEHQTLSLELIKTIYTLLEDPKLFISESILTSYVSTVTILNLPAYLPKIFHLYAHKPLPVPKTSPIKYTEPWSRAPKYAVPLKLADMAIDSAIQQKDLPLCISIIDTTVGTPQYKIAKFIRRAAIPLSGAASVVPLSWALSNMASTWQLSWDPDMFFWMCMSGSAAYLGTMGTLLFITVTTWNDHHKRVRWVPGTPLTRRWYREEERLFLDKIALGWGYKEENRHGEEVGEEWEALREECGARGLEVDRSSLLPGML